MNGRSGRSEGENGSLMADCGSVVTGRVNFNRGFGGRLRNVTICGSVHSAAERSSSERNSMAWTVRVIQRNGSDERCKV